MEDITSTTPEVFSEQEKEFIFKIQDSLTVAQERLAKATNPATRLLAHAAVAYRSWQLAPYATEM